GNRIGTNGDGTSDTAERNVIVADDDVEIFGQSTIVAGNYIGTDITGTMSLLPDADAGIWIQPGASGTRVGVNSGDPDAAAEANVISGILSASSSTGVRIQGASNTTVAGNFIGTDPTGTFRVGNGTGVALIGGSTNNVIGGTVAADRNIISGNTAA